MNTTESRYAPYTIGSIISADSTTIGYRQIGSGPGMVLLHGATTSGQDFTSHAEGLADAFTTYLPDRRGRGLSGPFGADYSMQKEVEDLTALLNQTGTHLVYGVSAGGLICLQTALTVSTIEKRLSVNLHCLWTAWCTQPGWHAMTRKWHKAK